MLARLLFISVFAFSGFAWALFDHTPLDPTISVTHFQVNESSHLVEFTSSARKDQQLVGRLQYKTQVVDRDGIPTLLAYVFFLQRNYDGMKVADAKQQPAEPKVAAEKLAAALRGIASRIGNEGANDGLAKEAGKLAQRLDELKGELTNAWIAEHLHPWLAQALAHRKYRTRAFKITPNIQKKRDTSEGNFTVGTPTEEKLGDEEIALLGEGKFNQSFKQTAGAVLEIQQVKAELPPWRGRQPGSAILFGVDAPLVKAVSEAVVKRPGSAAPASEAAPMTHQ